MPSSRLQTLKQDYDRRASTYDDGVFHHTQARDYIKWMDLKSGQQVLDLACGTGNVTIPAAQIVGHSGQVIGVDISPASLEVARSKSIKAGVDVKFLEHDICHLSGLSSEGIASETFDIISCASAFIVVENPGEVVKGWAKLLKKGGKIIYDVPSGDSTIQWVFLARVAEKLGKPVTYPRAHLDSMEKLKKYLVDAGLDAEESFVTDDYEGEDKGREFVAEESGVFFDELFDSGKGFAGFFKELAEPDVRPKARELFVDEMRAAADENGIVKSHFRFYMAIGRKKATYA